MSNLENTLYLADCIDLLREWHSTGQTNFLDLTYIDPPFNSDRTYNVLFDSKLTEEAFQDTWSNVTYLDELEGIASISPSLYNFLKMLETTGLPKAYISYLTSMSIRCWYMREMLKPTGSFYYHCDPTAGHYVKIMLDYIFGIQNFRNEIVWCYGKWTNSANHFQKNHDTILMYTKGDSYNFNRIFDKENLRSHHLKGYHTNTVGPQGDKKSQIIIYDRTKVTDDLIKKYDNVVYREEQKLVVFPDWWNISIINSQAKERLGYPTQKPEKLIERIILASSNPGDIVADFFMGGGTTISVAAKLGRKFIGTDINYRALQITHNRLEELNKELKKDFFIYGIPRSSEELRKMVADGILGKEKNSRFAFEDVIVKYYLNGVTGNEKKVGDHSIDGRFIFEYQGKKLNGLVQVTTGAGIGHFKSFCSEIGKGTGDLGVYVCFADKITKGMYHEAKQYGKLGYVDKVQILTVEDLVDNNKMFEIPKDGALEL